MRKQNISYRESTDEKTIKERKYGERMSMDLIMRREK